jgi:hypothetical protein
VFSATLSEQPAASAASLSFIPSTFSRNNACCLQVRQRIRAAFFRYRLSHAILSLRLLGRLA